MMLSINLQVRKYRPKDKDAECKYTECKKIVHQEAFRKAIAVEDKKSVSDSVDLNSMGVLISLLCIKSKNLS